jgi:hypothetical protein
VLCCVVQKEEEEVGVGGRGKYPWAPPHIRKKREEKQADRKVPDRPLVVKGERPFKKIINRFICYKYIPNVKLMTLIWISYAVPYRKV